jgi:hypothetical protein
MLTLDLHDHAMYEGRYLSGDSNMKCYLCQQPITSQDEIEYHHPIYKSRGGVTTFPLIKPVIASITASKAISKRGER